MELLSQNSKMKKSSNNVIVYNFTLPAFRTMTGDVVCPNAGVCAAGCYARQGTYMFSNVAKKHAANYEESKLSSFTIKMIEEVRTLKKRAKKPLYIRIHDSGDFYSDDYLQKWIMIARVNSDVTFYAYTKNVEQFKRLKDSIPANFIYIFSLGGKQDALIDREKDRHSRVFESEEQLGDYTNASQDDMLALTENKRVGLVYHGIKKYENTAWRKSV